MSMPKRWDHNYKYISKTSRVHPILKQQQHHDINANGIPAPLFPASFSHFSTLQHSSTPPLPPHIPVPSSQQPTHPFVYNPLSMAAAAVAHHKSLQQQHAASNVSYDSPSSNRGIENSTHKSGKIYHTIFDIFQRSLL